MVRVLVTGGTGFIGSHLVRDCLRRGDEVTVLTRPEGDPRLLDEVMDRIVLYRAVPDDAPAIASILAKVRPERVFLLAAATRFPDRDGPGNIDRALGANVEPLRIMLEAIAGLPDPPRAVVRSGTLAEVPGDGTAPVGPAGIYGLSMLMGTHLLRIWREWAGIPAVTARLSLTYGGGQSADFFVPGAIAQALLGQADTPRQPAARRDLLHVDDAVAALQLIADHAAELPPVLNVSTGAPVSLGELAEIIADLSGLRLDAPDDTEQVRRGEDDIVSALPAPELLALGWKPRTPLREGLAQVIAWQRDRGKPSLSKRRNA